MDDGLLLNFEVGDAAVRPSSTQYKGRWKERALSKKWDRIKAKKAISKGSANWQPSESRPPASQSEKTPRKEQPISAENAERPLKRKRTVASSSNATPVIPRNFTSSSLFTSNPEIPISKPNPPTIAPASVPLTGDFVSLGVNPAICSHLGKSLEVTTPTEIQRLAIPHLLESTRDTFLRAQTGSGKTLAFILPILHTLLSLSEEKRYDRTSGLFAIILTPTRELAKQIEKVLTTLTAGTWIVPGWFLGGERKKSEKARLTERS